MAAYGTRIFALEYLTLNGAHPAAFVEIAAEAGYDAVGLRAHPADPNDSPHDLSPGTTARRDTQSALVDTGMDVLDIEVFPVHADTTADDVNRVLESAAFFGARYLNVT